MNKILVQNMSTCSLVFSWPNLIFLFIKALEMSTQKILFLKPLNNGMFPNVMAYGLNHF